MSKDNNYRSSYSGYNNPRHTNNPNVNKNEKFEININTNNPMNDIVKKILQDQTDYVSAMITSGSSYRKLHDILASILDNASNLNEKDAKEFFNKQLPKVRIIVDYQKERGLIKEELKSAIDKMIDELINANEKNLHNLIENSRLFLDSLAVIAKKKK